MRTFLLFASSLAVVRAICFPTITTAKGWLAPQRICSGQLIFEDNFDWFDLNKWEHEVNTDGGGNHEFQAYVNSRANSWTQNGVLHIRPTLNLPTNQGPQSWIPNPINSARIRTRGAFAFKYGRVEVRARIPAGDWIWPALWFLPEDMVYGGWPRSGEIDLMEARGNRKYWLGGTHSGVEQVATTLHFGPRWDVNGFNTAHRSRNWAPGFHTDFHKYAMVWTPDKIEFTIDDIHHDTIWVGSGFWDRGNFWWSGLANPWATASKAAPFDKEFHMLINTAIGGDFFPDDAVNGNGHKPWSSNSANPMLDFWNGRNQWLSSWKMHTDASHFLVDYVRVWAL